MPVAMSATFELPTLHCYRCGASWTPRRPMIRMCPRCRSRLWDQPRIRISPPGRGLGVEDIIAPRRDEILALARKYGATNLRVFGSIARHEAGPASDADFLVDFTGRWHGPKSRLYLMGREMEELLGRPVDLVREESLHWYVQPQIVSEAVPV